MVQANPLDHRRLFVYFESRMYAVVYLRENRSLPANSGGLVSSKRLIFVVLGCLIFFMSGSVLAGSYPESTDILQQLAEKVIAEMEEKAEWRFVPGQDESEKFVKTPWRSGDRQTVAVYLFREEGTNAHLPFGARFEKQLELALGGSSKFMLVMRDMKKFYDMKYREIDFMIDENTASSVGKVLGARYFLTGSYWRDGNETFIQAALWDAELGSANHAQVKITGTEWAFVKKRLTSYWWKGGLGLLTLLVMMGVIRLLNRSVCYNLRSRENRTIYILIQVGFGLTLLSAGYFFVVWWVFPG